MSVTDIIGWALGITFGVIVCWYFTDLRRRAIRTEREIANLRRDVSALRSRSR